MGREREGPDNTVEGEKRGAVWEWDGRKHREDVAPCLHLQMYWLGHTASLFHASVSAYVKMSAFRDYLRGLNNNLVHTWYITCMALLLTSSDLYSVVTTSLTARAQIAPPTSILTQLQLASQHLLTPVLLCSPCILRAQRGSQHAVDPQ